MAFFTTVNVRIAGISAAVPKDEISNWDYELLSVQERKMLVKTIGVENKRRAPKSLTTSDLCFEAAEKLIEELNWEKNEVDLLLYVSQSKDYILPSTSCILQDRLGLSKSTIALDIGLGCSGYIYGLSVINSMMSSGQLKKGLLLVGDNSLATSNYKDTSTFPLFGDAATVTALEFSEGATDFHFDLRTDGSGYDAIIIPHGGLRRLPTVESFDEIKDENGLVRKPMDTHLKGFDVFNFSVNEVPKSIKEFYAETKTQAEDYDYFVMHQANLLMNESIRKKTGFEKEQVPYSLAKFGNTSSASIPITIVSELSEQLNKSNKILAAGFGVGLSWGVASFDLENVVCPPIIEVE